MTQSLRHLNCWTANGVMFVIINLRSHVKKAAIKAEGAVTLDLVQTPPLLQRRQLKCMTMHASVPFQVTS